MHQKSGANFPGLSGCAQVLAKSSSSPLLFALAFSILATTSSILAAHYEGRLIDFEYVKNSAGGLTAVVPFSRNLSTLADFIVLNPVVIFFLQKSRILRRQVDQKFGFTNLISPYHRIGLILLSVTFGMYAMKFYVEGSQFMDATFVPRSDGHSAITMTGWIVYSWTALYIAALCYAFIEQGVHVNRIIHLNEKDIPYAPFHRDEAGGVRFIMEPSLNFGYALIGLLLTFVVFIIHDRVLYHIETNRLLGFALYVVVAVPLFLLPFYHLHRLMKQRRGEYLFDMDAVLEGVISVVKTSRERHDWKGVADYLTAIENIEKCQRVVATFPVWPVPISLAIPPFGSMVAACLPLVQKLLTSAFPLGFSIPGP
jgi:hypothetical protein